MLEEGKGDARNQSNKDPNWPISTQYSENVSYEFQEYLNSVFVSNQVSLTKNNQQALNQYL